MVSNPNFAPHTTGFGSPVSTSSFYQALLNLGFSPNAAAGITGNAIYESGGNANTIYLNPPTGANSGDAAVGAMQWEGSRGATIAPTLQSQTQQIYNEISGGGQGITLAQINSASSPGAAASMINYNYERPQYPSASDANRQSYATQVFNSNQNATASSPNSSQPDDPTASGTGNPSSTSGGTPNGDWVGTGSSGGDAPDMAVTNTSTSSGAAAGDQYSGFGTLNSSGGPLSSNSPAPGLSTTGTGNFGSLSSAPANNATTDATPVSPASGNPITPTAASGSGASAATAPTGTAPTSSSASTASAGGGSPIDITNAPQVGTQAASTISSGATTAANTVSKALGGVTSGLGSDTSSVESTGTGWLNSIFGDVNNTLVRVGFVAAGLFVLLLAGLFFYLDSRNGEPAYG
jgi:trimeric autotransporter adhesin